MAASKNPETGLLNGLLMGTSGGSLGWFGQSATQELGWSTTTNPFDLNTTITTSNGDTAVFTRDEMYLLGQQGNWKKQSAFEEAFQRGKQRAKEEVDKQVYGEMNMASINLGLNEPTTFLEKLRREISRWHGDPLSLATC